MILYNTTFKVDLDATNEFKIFIENYFSDEKHNKELYQLLDVDDTDGVTYCLQFLFKNLESYNAHIADHDAVFKTEIVNTFDERVLFFSSVLQKI
ncbi:MAG: DUF4286 family protein [Chitinophagales bacterium]